MNKIEHLSKVSWFNVQGYVSFVLFSLQLEIACYALGRNRLYEFCIFRQKVDILVQPTFLALQPCSQEALSSFDVHGVSNHSECRQHRPDNGASDHLKLPDAPQTYCREAAPAFSQKASYTNDHHGNYGRQSKPVQLTPQLPHNYFKTKKQHDNLCGHQTQMQASDLLIG